jgi:sulfide:quinone oxidoreductase
MEHKTLTPELTVSAQITAADLPDLAAAGVKSLICNRPDGEGADQPTFTEIEAAAKAQGIAVRYLPVLTGKVSDLDAKDFARALDEMPAPVHAYCRTGNRSATLWALSEGAKGRALDEIVQAGQQAGYDLKDVAARIAGERPAAPAGGDAVKVYDVVIVGAGAGGIAVASSLLKRRRELSICIIDPAEVHYYQPGWTLVGGGVFTPQQTARSMASLIPAGVEWRQEAVAGFEPEHNRVTLENCAPVQYRRLIVAPGLKLNWQGIEGLAETLGQNGVTSNYRYDLAPYTWELVRNLRRGKALFTQPPMPIKCAGAPQKAMYLSADHWFRSGVLNDISIEMLNAGAVLFGVAAYVPALMEYVKKYNAQLSFAHRLTRIDGPAHKAWFELTAEDGSKSVVERDFDMIHVVPPQQAPDFIRASVLADSAGWVDVDQTTLRHKRFENIWSLGDVMNAPNAKTAAAARVQAPVVADNIVQDMGFSHRVSHYNGYGSCPLTVERGKIVLAEFGYGGKLLPSFPSWLIDGTKPTRAAWLLKERLLPPVYWQAMLKGREWLVKSESELVD